MMEDKSIDIKFRIAASKPELLEVLAIMKNAFSGLDINPPSSVSAETLSSIEAKARVGTFFLAYRESKAVGCVYIEAKEDHAYIGRLSVDPRLQSLGIGQKILSFALATISEMGFQCVKLNVRMSLPSNLKFFKKNGFEFEDFGTHEGFQAPTYEILSKQLQY